MTVGSKEPDSGKRSGEMRQSQHGKKPRSRGRKQHNPLSRVYDSSGPDVKIRGSASHIADKYLNLARDAHSSGDRIAAENYLQHAEHYLRIIAAAQAQVSAMTAQSSEQQSGDSGGEQPAMIQADNDGEQQAPSEPRSRRGRRRNGARTDNGDGEQPTANGELSSPADGSGEDLATTSGIDLEERDGRASASDNSASSGERDGDDTGQHIDPATDTLNA